MRLQYGSEPLQFGELRLPSGEGPHAVAIVIHGGFWRAAYDLEHINGACEALTRAGVATWNLEYRRIGNPGGGWSGTLQDVAQGADHLRILATGYQLDLWRVAAVGHSAGGHLALWLAARRRLPSGSALYSRDPLGLRGAVSLAGVADLRRAWDLRLSSGVVSAFLGGAPQEVPERYRQASPIELLPLGVPQRLIHGTNDTTVPIEIARTYVGAAVAAGDDAKLVELPGAGHFEAIDPGSQEWPIVEATVLSLLGDRSER